MCAGLARKVNRMPFDGGARGVAPLQIFWGNVPSSGLASSGEGASPFFYSEKNVRTVCFMETAYVAQERQMDKVLQR